MDGEECCKTCDDQGNLIPANYCQSKLNGNHGCPVPLCIPKPEGIYPHIIRQNLSNAQYYNHLNVLILYSNSHSVFRQNFEMSGNLSAYLQE